MDTLYVVPPQQIHNYWHLAKPLLEKAIQTSNGEYTIDQLKVVITQGTTTLLVVLDENQVCKCALTIEWINYPNSRVCYISYIGGQTRKDTWQQFVNWVKANGGTAVQGSTSLDGIVRLWRIKYGFEPKYTLMELNLTE